MKYRVIGWTDDYDPDYEEGETSFAAQAAIIDDIRANGYDFTGYQHQEFPGCTPVLNDGKIRNFTRRGFGGVMAEAHGYTGLYDYVLYTDYIEDYEGMKLPENRYPDPEFVPETDIAETFSLDGEDITLEDGTVRLMDNGKYRYIEDGDTVTIGDESYLVTDVDRYMDLTREARFALMRRMDYGNPEEERRAALEEFNRTPIVLAIKVETKAKET